MTMMMMTMNGNDTKYRHVWRYSSGQSLFTNCQQPMSSFDDKLNEK